MKNLTCSFAMFLLAVNSIFGLDASVTYATFYSQQSNYIELYLYFVSKTLVYKELEDKNLQATIEVTILFKKDGNIAKFDKYELKSPATTVHANFLDVKRYGLENGQYQVEVNIQDMNDPENKINQVVPVSVEYSNNKLQQSDIQLLSSYKKDNTESFNTKNGYFMETVPYDFYDKNASTLSFYNELYNIPASGAKEITVSYLIQTISGNKTPETVMVQHKNKSAAPIIPLLWQADISKLPSGNYRLVVEARNEAKELLTSKSIDFTRSNPYLNIKMEELTTDALQNEFVSRLSEEELRYGIKAIAMKVPDGDVSMVNIMLSKNDAMALKRYLFNYWATQSPNLPEFAYLHYMEIAKAVDKMYHSGFGYGFETDRGHTYMKYGQPDDLIAVENESSAPPYEIWTYNKLDATKQTNVKFVFYNPDLMPNGYTLLHSTAIGERNNPNWQRDLYKNMPGGFQGDDLEVKSGFNRHAGDNFDD